MSWYAKSYGWIKLQELENPEMNKQALKKHCSKNYPFAERKGHAYKAFLAAMRDVFGATRKPTPTGQIEMLYDSEGELPK